MLLCIECAIRYFFVSSSSSIPSVVCFHRISSLLMKKNLQGKESVQDTHTTKREARSQRERGGIYRKGTGRRQRAIESPNVIGFLIQTPFLPFQTCTFSLCIFLCLRRVFYVYLFSFHLDAGIYILMSHKLETEGSQTHTREAFNRSDDDDDDGSIVFVWLLRAVTPTLILMEYCSRIRIAQCLGRQHFE